MTSRRLPIVILAAGGILIGVLMAAGWGAGLRVNTSPSYPPGLWRIEALDRPVRTGDLVFICPPDTSVFEQAFERGYLRRGLCPSGLSPLIKTVVAMTNQKIEVGRSVSIDGNTLEHSIVSPFDGAGRRLDPFVGGFVPRGYLFLHSNFGASYDSRYFGPVPASGVLGLAQPILIFDP